MIVFPAIDLYHGEVVRLRQGKLTEKTVYPGTPVSFAQRWVADGARWLHVVDLNAAFEGEQRNLHIIKQIVAAARVPIQCGGGVRSLEAADALFQVGVARVIVGTLAIERPEVIEELLGKYSPQRIGVGVDARDGLVAVRGWAEVTQVKALDLVSRLERMGVRTLVFTDIATDGALEGPNVPALNALLESTRCSVIASGGVASATDITALRKLTGLHGVIVGKALFDGKVSLREAISLAA
jgi:phosphoribosylformimino-5-aminoimidazole carboxamide ribotide isomerase